MPAPEAVTAAPVCEAAARAPALDRPAWTAITGLVPERRRAMRAKFRGFPKDSRYSSATSVDGSSSQYSRTSLAEMSAGSRSTRRTTAPDRASRPDPSARAPRRRSARAARRDRRRAPRGERGVEGCRGSDHAQTVRADQPHPSRPARRHELVLAPRAVRPGLREARAQDEEGRTPFTAQSAATSTTSSGGVATTTSSGVSGRSSTDGEAPVPVRSADAAVDRVHRPSNPRRQDVPEGLPPTLPVRRDAPTTAIEAGSRKWRTAAEAETRSRSSYRSSVSL